MSTVVLELLKTLLPFFKEAYTGKTGEAPPTGYQFKKSLVILTFVMALAFSAEQIMIRYSGDKDTASGALVQRINLLTSEKYALELRTAQLTLKLSEVERIMSDDGCNRVNDNLRVSLRGLYE